MNCSNKKFKKELEQLINKYSVENDSNTPDFILADFVCRCLAQFAIASKARAIWQQGE